MRNEFEQPTSIEAEKAMNIIAIESKKALESFELKTSRDQINIQLEAFLQNLSTIGFKSENSLLSKVYFSMSLTVSESRRRS